MAVTYGFYNSLNGDRTYNAEQMSAIFDGIITDGVFSSIGGALMTIAGEGMQVLVKTGKAWFNSTWTLNDAQMALAVDTADVSLTRIDAVVLEVNSGVSTRENSIKMVKGTPSANPTKPTMAADEDLHQYALAYITVGAGVTEITSANIEVNVGKDSCPFITSVLQQTSVSDLFNQWEAEFDAWFANIKAQLAGDVAANLQSQIDELNVNVNKVEIKTTELSKNYGLKVNDILITANPNPGDEFVLCNGSAIKNYSGSSLPSGSTLTIGYLSSGELDNYGSIDLAYDDDDTIVWACSSYSSGTKVYVGSISTGATSSTSISSNSNRYAGVSITYFNGKWILLCVEYYDGKHNINVYSSDNPSSTWSIIYSTTATKNSSSTYVRILFAEVLNNTCILGYADPVDTSDYRYTTFLVSTDGINWTKVCDTSHKNYDLNIGTGCVYYNGYYMTCSTEYSQTLGGRELYIYYASNPYNTWTRVGLNIKCGTYCCILMLDDKPCIFYTDTNNNGISNIIDCSLFLNSSFTVIGSVDTDTSYYSSLIKDADTYKVYSTGYKTAYTANSLTGAWSSFATTYYPIKASTFGKNSFPYVVYANDTFIGTPYGTSYTYHTLLATLPNISLTGAYAFIKTKEPEVT